MQENTSLALLLEGVQLNAITKTPKAAKLLQGNPKPDTHVIRVFLSSNDSGGSQTKKEQIKKEERVESRGCLPALLEMLISSFSFFVF